MKIIVSKIKARDFALECFEIIIKDIQTRKEEHNDDQNNQKERGTNQ